MNCLHTFANIHIYSGTVYDAEEDLEVSTVNAVREFARTHRRAFATRCQVQPASHQVGCIVNCVRLGRYTLYLSILRV